MSINVLYTGCHLSEEVLQTYSRNGIIINSVGVISQKEIVGLIPNMEIYVPGGGEIVSEEIILNANKLALVVFCGVDYNYYLPMDLIRARSIKVVNAPGINSQAVAEHTLALILASSKNIIGSYLDTKDHCWEKVRSKELAQSTVGIVGMGNIGSLVARMLVKGFGCKVIYHSRTRKPVLEKELGMEYVSKEELCSESDIITVHIPFDKYTERMFGNEELQLMNANCDIVNTSHAEIFNPDALYNALKTKRIRTVCFDNFYFSNIANEGNLLAADKWGFLDLRERFILTPHCGYNTENTFQRIEQRVLENIDQFAKDIHSKSDPSFHE